MRSLFHYFTHDDTYGPGTDLAMVLLGIFILSAAIAKKKESSEFNSFRLTYQNQMMVIKEIAGIYNSKIDSSKDLNDTTQVKYEIKIDSSHGNNITVENFGHNQYFTFGEKILFASGSTELKSEGIEVIGNVGKVIKSNISFLKEIQIEGHADTIPPSDTAKNKYSNFKSNIELASARATSVFNFLRSYSGIDPSSNLISIVSFGEYKPVQRTNSTVEWDRKKLNVANNSKEKRDKNRRIEIVLIYR